ncbi:MAG: PQQ-like beta-propeller repeat protein [candidate division Zixibacteria bacterium]|nr:PQQ-like beta-propeller repeat protein [candidate division Zixibacteria bacterium]
MDKRYIQPYAGTRLNSFLPVEITAEGRPAWKMTYNETDIPGGAQFLYLLDNQRAIVDFGIAMFCVDLDRKKTLNFYRKSSNGFIRAAEGQEFYYVNSYRLMRVSFDDVDEDQEGYFIPNLGEFSLLTCLLPEKETFIAGVQDLGDPGKPEPALEIFRKNYEGIFYVWHKKLPGEFIQPPVSGSGQIVTAVAGTVSLVDGEGNLRRILQEDFSVLAASLGPDDLLYLVVTVEAGPQLAVYDLFGEKRWECAVSPEKPLQPPVVDNEGTVYLVGKNEITACRDGKNIWTYPTLSGRPLVTAAAGGRLVITDGTRLVCLDELGDELWVYLDRDGDRFVTPPVIDENGRVLAASDNKIVMIE